jgi:hypothetical protein
MKITNAFLIIGVLCLLALLAILADGPAPPVQYAYTASSVPPSPYLTPRGSSYSSGYCDSLGCTGYTNNGVQSTHCTTSGVPAWGIYASECSTQ